MPLEVYVNKFSYTRFEPWGYTNNPDIRVATSIVDYIFRWLGIMFLPGYREQLRSRSWAPEPAAATEKSTSLPPAGQQAAPAAERSPAFGAHSVRDRSAWSRAELRVTGTPGGKPVFPGTVMGLSAGGRRGDRSFRSGSCSRR